MSKLAECEAPAIAPVVTRAVAGPGDSPPLPPIPVIDVRRGGPVAHATLRREPMTALRDACFSFLPGMSGVAPVLDRVSSRWLARTPSPYIGEIAAIAGLISGGGVWFVNTSYEWGCTTRVDAAPVPRLWRTLDWPFPGLGKHVEVALQDGGAGVYANVTWPGAVGVLTAVAPGRFAAAINQAPMFRRTRGAALIAYDIALNAVETYRDNGCWPAPHLLRHVFDTCASFDEAVEVLSTAPLARPTLYSIAGSSPSQACLIERTRTEAVVRRGNSTIANDWHPDSPRRDGYWMPRGALVHGIHDSDRRRQCLDDDTPGDAFDWLRAPVLNGFTRLAVETSAATGELRVLGFEPTQQWWSTVRPATAMLEMTVARDHARPSSPEARSMTAAV
jgi:hypothetical protein